MLLHVLTMALALSASAAPSAAEAAAADAIAPRDRAQAVEIIAGMRRIVTTDGVERLEAVRIGGIDQWVSVRGNSRDNPVLLMLHGGPGWVSMPASWYFQRGWEEYFTVVQWDQRGAGKTYAANDPPALAPTMTSERMIADTEEMVAWIREEFGQDRIFVLGHSWGSFLGVELAKRRPEWLHAYVGVGQIASGPESERRGWQWTLDRAREDGNEAAVEDLLALAPYAESTDPVALEDLMLQRKWLNHYGGMVYNRDGGAHDSTSNPVRERHSRLTSPAAVPNRGLPRETNRTGSFSLYRLSGNGSLPLQGLQRTVDQRAPFARFHLLMASVASERAR